MVSNIELQVDCSSELIIVYKVLNVLKGGKRPPPFLLATWGSGGRRFKSGRPDHKLNVKALEVLPTTRAFSILPAFC